MANKNSWFPYQQFVDFPRQSVNVDQAQWPRPSGPSPGKTVEIPKLGFGDPTSVKLIGDVPWSFDPQGIDRIPQVTIFPRELINWFMVV